jgi:hypothetical protein
MILLTIDSIFNSFASSENISITSNPAFSATLFFIPVFKNKKKHRQNILYKIS